MNRDCGLITTDYYWANKTNEAPKLWTLRTTIQNHLGPFIAGINIAQAMKMVDVHAVFTGEAKHARDTHW